VGDFTNDNRPGDWKLFASVVNDDLLACFRVDLMANVVRVSTAEGVYIRPKRFDVLIGAGDASVNCRRKGRHEIHSGLGTYENKISHHSQKRASVAMEGVS
jgi:hypothetical protein